MTEHTTPYEREILTHHYTSWSPFPRDTELYREYVEKFARMGLLRVDGGKVEANKEALRTYMDALAAVPLPVQKWVVP
jgi:hypothetical protein